MPFAYREAWLAAAAEHFKRDFEMHGYPLPDRVRVTCGWPSQGGLALKSRTIGECWNAKCSADGANEIFISPVLDDPIEVAAVLVHELDHAAVGLGCGHKGPFKWLALQLGLVGPMRSTRAGTELTVRLNALCRELGSYPHAALNAKAPNRKKQGTRLMQCVCPNCGYLARITKKWIKVGMPLCPCGEFLVPAGTIDEEEE